MRKVTIGFVAVSLLLLCVTGCDDDNNSQKATGEACSVDEPCASGLNCYSNICISNSISENKLKLCNYLGCWDVNKRLESSDDCVKELTRPDSPCKTEISDFLTCAETEFSVCALDNYEPYRLYWPGKCRMEYNDVARCIVIRELNAEEKRICESLGAWNNDLGLSKMSDCASTFVNMKENPDYCEAFAPFYDCLKTEIAKCSDAKSSKCGSDVQAACKDKENAFDNCFIMVD